MSRSALRVMLGILLTVLLVVGAVGGFCWWKIAGLKEKLVRDLEKAIGAQVQVASLDFDFWSGELHAAGITLVNVRPEAPWDKGSIGEATVRFHLGDVFSPTLPITVEVASWNIVLHPPKSALTDATPPTVLPETPDEDTGAGGRRIEVTRLSAHEGSMEIDLADQRQVQIRGVSFESGSNGTAAWTTEMRALSVTAGSLAAGASSVEIRSETDKVTFSNLSMACDPGFITGEGEVGLQDAHQARFSLKATDLPVAMLVSAPWQMKLAGLVSGQLDYTGNDRQAGSAEGKITMNHAKFNVLPAMDKVISMVGLPDLTNIEVDQATSDYQWDDATLHLTNLDIRKTDVVRVAGTVDIGSAGQIDGKLKLGLPSTVTAKWPDLQTKVFSVALDDYNWTDVHLTGTPDHLQEDLTPRLVAVGVDSGGSLINQAAQKASDVFHSFFGK